MGFTPKRKIAGPPKGMTKKQQIEYAAVAELQRFVKKADDEQQYTEAADPYRFFFLRPSSFPFCGLRKFLEQRNGYVTERTTGFGTSFFTGVGTTVHSVYQRYLGQAGSVYGDWKCKCVVKGKPKIRRFTTYEWCDKCKSAPEYLELKIDYKNTLIGHIDTVWRDKLGKYWVVDYKTTSSKKCDQHKTAVDKGKKGLFPYKSNTFQITAYVPVLELQYNIKINGTILFYVSRDNPFYSYVMIANHMNEAQKAERLALLDRDIKIHRKMLRVESAEQAELLLKYKLCSDLKDYTTNYKDEYEPCPYLEKCLGSNPSMEKEIQKALKTGLKNNSYPLLRHAPIKIKEKLGLAS